MKTEEVVVKTFDLEDRAIKGEVYGPVAVHRSLNGVRWTVTHIGTGGAIYSRFETLKRARAAAKELATLDWSKVKTPRSRKALSELSARVGEIVRMFA